MTILQDLKFAARLLIKDRWFTLAAGTALALGIGANAAVFTLVNAVLLRGLPFDEPERIIGLGVSDGRGRGGGVSPPEFDDWREQSRTMSELSATVGTTVNVADEGKAPEQVQGAYISTNLFRLIGETPALGRGFTDEDDRPGAEPVVLLGHGLWKNRYGSDPAILGKTIRANSKPLMVVGVMRPDMMFPNNGSIWIPVIQLPPDTLSPRRENRAFNVIGRLAPGVTLAQARAEFAAIGQRLAESYPANKDLRPELTVMQEQVNGGPIFIVFTALMGAVAFVLLIACANVANLLLSRATSRAREISVRSALGATRWRIVRQLLIESLLLAVISGAVGFVLAVFGIRWFDGATQDVGKPYWMTFDLDAVVFAFIAAVCLGTAVLFGLAPAMHISKTDPNTTLKEGGRGGTTGIRARRWTSALIVTELVLTVVLLAGAGYMMRSFFVLYRMDIGVGVDTSRMLTMQLYLPLTKYPQPGPRTAVYEQFEERLRGISAIQASALSSNAPLGGGMGRALALEGRPVNPGDTLPTVSVLTVGDAYFETLKLPLVRGRALNNGDGLPGHEAAVVNQRFVALHFPNEDPIGRRIHLTGNPAPARLPAAIIVVGVVPNVRQRGARDPQPDPVVYLPYRSDPQRTATLLIRTQSDPAAVTASVREAMRVVEPDLPLFRIQTLDELIARSRWEMQTFGTMFGVFAGIALLLSAVGLYAVTAYSVSQRTQEIGIRMALGAQPSRMLWLVLRRGLVQLAIGLPIGLAGAYAVGKFLQSLLVQTGPGDPLTLVSIVALLVVMSVLACLWPARRAARLDPMVALRSE